MKQLIALALVVIGLSGCAGVQGSNAPAPNDQWSKALGCTMLYAGCPPPYGGYR